MEEFTGHCSCCGAQIPEDSMRGKVTRPTPETALIEAHAPCLACRTWIPFYFVVRANPLRLEWVDEETREWLVVVGKPVEGLMARGLRWMRDALLFRLNV